MEKKYTGEYKLLSPVKFGEDTLTVIKYLNIDTLTAEEVERLDRGADEDIHVWIKRFLLYITPDNVSMEHIQKLTRKDYAALGKFPIQFMKELQSDLGITGTT